MQITLEKTLVTYLKIESILDDSQKKSKRNFKIDFDKVFSDENTMSFIIRFRVSITNSKLFDLNITYDCNFITDGEIDEEFKSSQFPNVNAPAIAYPFLRSYISFFTLNSGFEVVMLPTINFTKFLSQSKEMSKNPML
ncbi:MAG: protein-export chaperone SecB [Mucilaginibacter sp.]